MGCMHAMHAGRCFTSTGQAAHSLPGCLHNDVFPSMAPGSVPPVCEALARISPACDCQIYTSIVLLRAVFSARAPAPARTCCAGYARRQ